MSSDVLATQNDIAVRATARPSPSVLIPTSDSVFTFRPRQYRTSSPGARSNRVSLMDELPSDRRP